MLLNASECRCDEMVIFCNFEHDNENFTTMWHSFAEINRLFDVVNDSFVNTLLIRQYNVHLKICSKMFILKYRDANPELQGSDAAAGSRNIRIVCNQTCGRCCFFIYRLAKTVDIK